MSATLDRLRAATPDELGEVYESVVLDVFGVTSPRVARWTEAYAHVSQRLTAERATALATPSGTWGDDDHRLAAALVFGQRTLLTLLPILRAYPLGSREVTDMGSGSGAAALAATICGVERVTLVERSAEASTYARDLLRRCDVHVDSTIDGLESVRVRTGAVLAAHSLNEVFEGRPPADMAKVLLRWLRDAGPDGRVVVLEPGTHAAATRLQAVRDVVQRDARLLGPCTHAAPCPMVAQPRDWCHFTRRATVGPLARVIMQGAGRNPNEQPYAWLACATAEAPVVAAGSSRVLSVRLVGKGKTAATTCDDRGIRSLTVLDRRSGAEQVTDLTPGCVVSVDDGGLTLRGDGHRVESPNSVRLIRTL